VNHFEVGDTVRIIESPSVAAAAAASRDALQSRVDVVRAASVCTCTSLFILLLN